ncbi:MAG: DUF3857 domain-containing protein [Bacteroidota bacterium]
MARSVSALILFAILFIVSTAQMSLAQTPPVKWGDIPMADLQMKTLPSDTNASAYILCDYGTSQFNNDVDIETNRHMRIKIFNSKGYEWGTHVVGIYDNDYGETISDIEGVTYSLDEKGEVVKTKLRNKDIYEEKTDDSHIRYKFTLPALQPGCIVEFRYKILARNPVLMRDWKFQYSAPVRWSEYVVTTPVNLVYAIVSGGSESYEVFEDTDVTQVFTAPAIGILGRDVVNCTRLRRAVANLPALVEEPFSTSLEDRRNSVQLQLRGYQYVGMLKFKPVLPDWPEFLKELLGNKYFGKIYREDSDIDKLQSEITAGLSGSKAKAEAIYNWVARNIVWNGGNDIFADRPLEEVLERKTGNSAEISFLLIALLKSGGISCDPVITSTRAIGRITTVYPIIGQFNYTLVRALIDNTQYYLDATDAERSMDLLPFRILNSAAVVVKPGAPEFVSLSSAGKNTITSLTRIKIQPDGSISGTVQDGYSEYAAVQVRKDLKDTQKKQSDVVSTLLDAGKYGLNVDSIKVANLDSLRRVLSITSNISSSSYAQCSGDMIYINPHIIHRNDENPLKNPVRKYPVDFGYRYSHTDLSVITIPDGFEIKERLQDRVAYAAAGKLKFSRQVTTDSTGVITVASKTEFNDISISPKYYEQLRDFFSDMVSIQSEQLVLQKKKNVTPPVIVKQTDVKEAEKNISGDVTKSNRKSKNDKKKSK